jgi:hypothetical protein
MFTGVPLAFAYALLVWLQSRRPGAAGILILASLELLALAAILLATLVR